MTADGASCQLCRRRFWEADAGSATLRRLSLGAHANPDASGGRLAADAARDLTEHTDPSPGSSPSSPLDPEPSWRRPLRSGTPRARAQAQPRVPGPRAGTSCRSPTAVEQRGCPAGGPVPSPPAPARWGHGPECRLWWDRGRAAAALQDQDVGVRRAASLTGPRARSASPSVQRRPACSTSPPKMKTLRRTVLRWRRQPSVTCPAPHGVRSLCRWAR